MGRTARYLSHLAAVSLGMAAVGAFHPSPDAAAQGVATTPQPAPGAIAASVDAFYAQIRTFSSDFNQEFFIKVHPGASRRSHGRVVFQKPGRMSFQSDNGNRVVSDGQVLKMYEPSNQQMIVQSLAGTQYPAALAFLMGQGNLTASFTFQLLGPNIPGTYRLVGTPVSSNAPYAKVVFYVDAATSQVRKVSILDAQGNRNQFEFVNPIVNQPSPAGAFVFTPPPGTQIVTSAPSPPLTTTSPAAPTTPTP
jgi:outer membrane lipoprotein carrier protein